VFGFVRLAKVGAKVFDFQTSGLRGKVVLYQLSSFSAKFVAIL
jgi:hypothetical protein